MSQQKQIRCQRNRKKRELRNRKPLPNERKLCLSKVRYSKLGALLAASKHGGTIRHCQFCNGWHHTMRGA